MAGFFVWRLISPIGFCLVRIRLGYVYVQGFAVQHRRSPRRCQLTLSKTAPYVMTILGGQTKLAGAEQAVRAAATKSAHLRAPSARA